MDNKIRAINQTKEDTMNLLSHFMLYEMSDRLFIALLETVINTVKIDNEYWDIFDNVDQLEVKLYQLKTLLNMRHDR